MRLTKIKLAGFKTFVDPTTLSFPSNLTGIIGPNGCGKSNIIDAIKWVLGESSARSLRGESMEDVIFSGSSSRDPISHASIELHFDNSLNTLDSKFAQYNEIVIKREVSRDGSSQYYLNNTKCRRKDVREVFLGTGLGPRSYAIIEQGMIPKLVESKPEELRTYVEEAAGISKYKEKRRETELRLKHTKDNLSRLNDVMKEIKSQLNKLERQATSANTYKQLKQEERKLKLEMIAGKYKKYQDEIFVIEKEISKDNIQSEKYNSELTNKDSLIEKTRLEREDEQKSFNEVQGDFYQIGGEIAKCEKDIEHSQKTETSRQKTLADYDRSINDLMKINKDNKDKIDTIHLKITDENKKLKDISDKMKQLTKDKTDANNALQKWQSTYNNFLSSQSETKNKEEIERTKIKSYEKSLESLNKRLKILETQKTTNEDKTHKNEILTDALDLQEKVTSLSIDFERSNIDKFKNKTLDSIPNSLNLIISKFKSLIEQIKYLLRSQQEEMGDINKKIKEYNHLINSSISNLKQIEIDIKSNDIKKDQLEKDKIDLKKSIDDITSNLESSQNNQNQLNISLSSLNTEKTALLENIKRYSDELTILEDRKRQLLSDITMPENISDDMHKKLQKLLQDRQEKEKELSVKRENISEFDKIIHESETQKLSVDSKIQNLRNELESKKIKITEKITSRDALKENTELDIKDIDLAIKNLNLEFNIEELEINIDKIKKRIDNLGPINLAAIDELSEQQERKKYLDTQYDDLSKSIETLEGAIKKIDHETKSKFKEMFDNINENLNYFFTNIFGGGKAYLEMNEKDLLNTGVNIMARPPGKLVKNISALSGGEKAGTGIAFVFSIFKINPAPFCLLDEVDAPLDEGNNNRFCKVLKEMSNTVQFIFITHNKLTMESADTLSGVTMREPGVSKLVSVNVNEAINLTENKDNIRPLRPSN
ncbi:MAG: hypothetical protein CMD65_03300 [Gammaproteobacteria bacterium]|nr:hypothetical protein [Gammaproteobacteria bacterium]